MHDSNIWDIKKGTRNHDQSNIVGNDNTGTKIKQWCIYIKNTEYKGEVERVKLKLHSPLLTVL